jgi:hypothetical protein
LLALSADGFVLGLAGAVAVEESLALTAPEVVIAMVVPGFRSG